MKKSKVSIAMATYNGEKYLQEQLDSFCRQTFLPFELVVYDDCSSDGTCEIIENFKKMAPFSVKLIRGSKNLGGSVVIGYGLSFSEAANACSGDYIFFSDQDDVWFNNKIEKHLELYGSNPNVSVITSKPHNVDENLNEITNRKSNPFADCITSKYVMGCCSSIKKEFIDLILPIRPGCSHDWWITICSDSVGQFLEVDDELQLYRLHGNQTSKVFGNKQCGPLEKLKKSIRGYLEDREYKHIATELEIWNYRITAIDEISTKLRQQFPDYYHLHGERYYCEMKKIQNALKSRLQLRKMRFMNRLKHIVNNFSSWYRTRGEKNLSASLKYAFKDLVL